MYHACTYVASAEQHRHISPRSVLRFQTADEAHEAVRADEECESGDKPYDVHFWFLPNGNHCRAPAARTEPITILTTTCCLDAVTRVRPTGTVSCGKTDKSR